MKKGANTWRQVEAVMAGIHHQENAYLMHRPVSLPICI